MQNDRVSLPLDVAKCVPTSGCSLASQCARAQVRADAGRPLADFTYTQVLMNGKCWRFMDANAHRPKPAEPAAKPVRDYLKGLL